MPVKIITDSASDLSPEIVKELGITVIPVYVSVSGQSYRDGVDISLDEIYQKMAEGNILATTSQPLPTDFAEVYRRLLQETDEILSIHVSSRLSGTYNSAIKGQELANGNGRIEVLDSTSVSIGVGLLTIAAARLAQAGANLSHIITETKRAADRIHIWGLLDTLKYALRSGRLSKGKAVLGSLLAVKPMITAKQGEVTSAGIVRTRQKGIDKLVSNLCGVAETEEVCIAHSTDSIEAQSLKSRLSAILDEKQIHISRLGLAIGGHTGPGTLVMALREKLPAAENVIKNKGKKLIDLPSLRLPRFSIMPL